MGDIKMECSVRENNGRSVVVVQGDMDNDHAVSIFRETMLALLKSGKRDVVIDMSKVESINSHGIGKLLLFYKKFKEAGGEIKISSLEGHTKEVFETLMLDRLFKIE